MKYLAGAVLAFASVWAVHRWWRGLIFWLFTRGDQ